MALTEVRSQMKTVLMPRKIYSPPSVRLVLRGCLLDTVMEQGFVCVLFAVVVVSFVETHARGAPPPIPAVLNVNGEAYLFA